MFNTQGDETFFLLEKSIKTDYFISTKLVITSYRKLYLKVQQKTSNFKVFNIIQ